MWNKKKKDECIIDAARKRFYADPKNAGKPFVIMISCPCSKCNPYYLGG